MALEALSHGLCPRLVPDRLVSGLLAPDDVIAPQPDPNRALFLPAPNPQPFEQGVVGFLVFPGPCLDEQGLLEPFGNRQPGPFHQPPQDPRALFLRQPPNVVLIVPRV